MSNVFDFNPTNINPFPYWKWNKVLPAVYDDSLSQYEILCKLLNVVNNIIDSTNSTGEQVEQLTQLVQQLIDGGFPSGIVQYVTDIANAAIVDDITTINTRIAALQSEINVLDESIKTHFGVVGDSYSEGATDWPNLIAPIIGKTVIDKAVAGTGFVTGNTTFKQQLINLSNDTNFNKCAFIIVYGGVNDWRVTHATAATMATAFSEFFTIYNNLSYKPRLIFAFGNMSRANLAENNDFGIWYKECLNSLYALKMPGIVNYVPFWLWENVSWFMSDNLHPNDEGQKVIASRMMQLINGTYSGVYFRKRIKNDSPAAPFTGTPVTEVEFNNGLTTIEFRGAIDTSWSSGTYYVPASIGEGTYAFGAAGNTSFDPEIITSVAKVITNKADGYVNRVAVIEYGINRKNNNTLIYCTGDPSAYSTTATINTSITIKA